MLCTLQDQTFTTGCRPSREAAMLMREKEEKSLPSRSLEKLPRILYLHDKGGLKKMQQSIQVSGLHKHHDFVVQRSGIS